MLMAMAITFMRIRITTNPKSTAILKTPHPSVGWIAPLAGSAFTSWCGRLRWESSTASQVRPPSRSWCSLPFETRLWLLPIFWSLDQRFKRFNRGLGLVSGLVSLVFGLFIVYQMGFVNGLFTGNPNWTPK
jgi:hypothetical protein